MKKIYLPAFLFSLVASVGAQAASLACDHNIMGAPFASVELELLPEEKLGEGAKITMYGRSHFESVSQEEAREGEMFHLWLSKENPQNKVEMFVYREDNAGAVRSKLVNHNVSFGKEIPGICRRVGAF